MNELNKNKIINFLKEKDFVFIEFDDISFEEVLDYSPSSRLVDSLSLSYVVDKQYKILGVVRKKVRNKSVKDHCLENIESDKFNYIYVENKKVM